MVPRSGLHGEGIMSATSHNPENPLSMKTVLSHVVVPVIMGLAMALAYLGGFHKPAPHGVPVAVVGSAQEAGAVAAGLQQKAGDALDVRTVATADQAKDELRHLKISGAYVPNPKRPELLVASASSDSTTSAVTKVFTKVAAAENAPLTVTDVVPLDENDPIGQNGFFYLVTLSVGSYAAAIAIGAAGATRRFRERLGLLIGTAVVTATAQMAVASILFDMFHGHGGAVWALSVVYALIVMGVGVGLHAVVGRFSTLLFSVMFVALNFTSSGGVFQPAMQPGFYGWLHDFWLGSGFLQTLGHILYFGDADNSHGMWILIGWFLFGLFCLVLARLVDRRRRRLHHLATSHERMRTVLSRARSGELTRREAMDLELEEDVAV